MAHLLLALLLLVGEAGAFEAVAPKDGPEAAEAWFAQLHRFDALEAYEAQIGARRVQFMVARRWKEGRAQLLVDIRAPRAFEKVAFLLLQNRERSDDFFIYWPPLRKVLRVTAAELQAGMLPIGQLMTLGDLRPTLPGELAHTPLPDTVIEGQDCWVVESRPTGRRLGYDRMEIAISRETGVALRTRFYQGSRQVRRILVSPSDVRRFDDRYLPVRRRVEMLGEKATAEILLRNLMINPPLPDQLFSKQSLITQRFPSF
jgi:hypothetical protein